MSRTRRQVKRTLVEAYLDLPRWARRPSDAVLRNRRKLKKAQQSRAARGRQLLKKFLVGG